MNQAKNSRRRLFDFLFQEPLIPFALIGGLLFALYGFRQTEEKEVIHISPQTLQALEDMDGELRGRQLTENERQLLIDSYIDDEILLREAFRQGLEKKDSGVRKRLLTVMRTSLDEAVPEPTDAQLEEHFQRMSNELLAGDVYTFDQAFFSFGTEPPNFDETLRALVDGSDHRKMGEQHFLGSTINRMPAKKIRRTFGRELSENLVKQEVGVWKGPFESRDGIHFVRVIQRDSIPSPTFEQLKDYLKQDWMYKKRREIQSNKIAEIAKRYQIQIEGQGQ